MGRVDDVVNTSDQRIGTIAVGQESKSDISTLEECSGLAKLRESEEG